ncbi:MAG: MBOAT family protein [Lachnospiraceae bacterium]|nr:MBOAT family protein [Lachnospiraceae bacterium]
MLFNSINFLIFFPFVLIIYFILPSKIRYIWLLISSYYFYMCWNLLYSALIAISTVITYICGIIVGDLKENIKFNDKQKNHRMKLVITASFVTNLGILIYFKYTNFLIDTINLFLNKLHMNSIPVFDILLPVGISFYTFQALGYTIDVYRGNVKAEKNLLRYALFVSFFPQLVAGPIERSKNLLSQIQEEPQHKLWNYERIATGVVTMFWGLFMKVVITDRVAVLVDHIFKEYQCYGLVALSIGALAFALQIYCDFNGYSTIAIGAAKVLGFDLMDNFNTPYFSQSITEFWRRWHISLSTWFRDYLYIPLGGSRCNKWKQYRNILITFTVSGLWHGANWTYVFWGFLHGIYQIIEKEFTPLVNRINLKCHTKVDSFGYKFSKILCTFVFVDLAWIFFRAESLYQAVHYIERMIRYRDWWSLFDQSIYTWGLDITQMHILCMALGVLLLVDGVKYIKNQNLAEWLDGQWIVFRWGVIILLLVSCMVFGYYGPGFNSAQFIYFQF